MPTFLITAPDGRKFQVSGNGTKEEALAHIQQQYAGPDFSQFDTPADQQRPDLAAALESKAANANQNGSIADPIAQGFTFGLNDELSGAIGGLIATAKGKTFNEGYDLGTGIARRNLEAQRRRAPVASAVGEIAGGLGGIAPAMLAGAPAAGAGLGALAIRGAAAGAGAGALYGYGAADGGGQGGMLSDIANPNRVAGAAGGAVTGAAIGAAAPVVGAGLRAVGAPFVDAVRARVNPAGAAAQKVTQRIEGSGRTIDTVANRIDRARTQGQNLSVADAGGRGAQTLARTVANTPGPGADRIAAQTNIAAMGQGERLKRLVGQVFDSPEGAYQAAKATVMDARSAAAKPYYDAAYRQPVPFTFKLEEMLQTPAGKAGLAAAKRNTANRREPWAQWFANIADDGTITDLRRVPDTRALDEVKRVLDNMVEAAKRPADGSPFAKALNTPESIAVQSVRDDLLNFLKTNNKPYAKALQVAGDNIRADEALEFGRNALKTDPRVIARKMGDPAAYGRDKVFDEGDRQLARIGVAEAIRDKIDNAGLTHNALLKFFANREQVARLRPFFKSPGDFSNFKSAILNEARKRKTLDFVRGNSTTARQLADLQEAGQMGETVNVGADLMRQGPMGAALSALMRGVRRLGGLTPEVADNIAKMLMTSDPRAVQGILQRVRAIEQQNINKTQRNNRLRQLLIGFASGQTGRTLAPAPSPQTDQR